MQKFRVLRTVFVVVRRFFFDTLEKNMDILPIDSTSRTRTLHHFPFSSFFPSAYYREQLWWNMLFHPLSVSQHVLEADMQSAMLRSSRICKARGNLMVYPM